MIRKDRRRTRRLPIKLDVDLRPITIQRRDAEAGAVIRTMISNVGPGGVMVDLPTEWPAGARFWARTNLNGRTVEFYAMVRHVTISIEDRMKVYSHGLQITAALAEVMDEFELLMRRYAKGEFKPGAVVGRTEDAAGSKDKPSDQEGATLAN